MVDSTKVTAMKDCTFHIKNSVNCEHVPRSFRGTWRRGTDGVFPRAPEALDYPYVVQCHTCEENLGRVGIAELVE